MHVGLVDKQVDTTYGYKHVGGDVQALLSLLSGRTNSPFARAFAAAKKPLIIVGSAVSEMDGGNAVYAARFLTPEWNGFSVLQRVARLTRRRLRPGLPPRPCLSLRCLRLQRCLLRRREIHIPPQRRRRPDTHSPPRRIRSIPRTPRRCGRGARRRRPPRRGVHRERRDVGQRGGARAAVPPPGAAREDWKVLRALGEVLGVELPYEDTLDVRDRMWEVAPSLVRYDMTEGVSRDVALLGLAASAAAAAAGEGRKSVGEKIGKAVFEKPISNLYQTDVVSRASKTMAECTRAFVLGRDHGFSEGEAGAESAKAQAFA
ncbi:hypothetical protein C0992_002783 [Termitomyces sp. T32_za158]|nr:hypothetical protein C0992_002783 [Termitomyces sp. T32_za158]